MFIHWKSNIFLIWYFYQINLISSFVNLLQDMQRNKIWIDPDLKLLIYSRYQGDIHTFYTTFTIRISE
jgi:hypothetical protein